MKWGVCISTLLNLIARVLQQKLIFMKSNDCLYPSCEDRDSNVLVYVIKLISNWVNKREYICLFLFLLYSVLVIYFQCNVMPTSLTYLVTH